jgi:hypothetical protein
MSQNSLCFAVQNILRGHETARRTLEERTAEVHESLLDHTRSFEDGLERALAAAGAPGGQGTGHSLMVTPDRHAAGFDDIVASLGLVHSEPPAAEALWVDARSSSFRDIAQRATAGMEGGSGGSSPCCADSMSTHCYRVGGGGRGVVHLGNLCWALSQGPLHAVGSRGRRPCALCCPTPPGSAPLPPA